VKIDVTTRLGSDRNTSNVLVLEDSSLRRLLGSRSGHSRHFHCARPSPAPWLACQPWSPARKCSCPSLRFDVKLRSEYFFGILGLSDHPHPVTRPLLAIPCPSHLCSQCVSPRAVTSDICCQCRLCRSSRCTLPLRTAQVDSFPITIAPKSLPTLRKLSTLLFAQQVDSFRINVAPALLDLLDGLAPPWNRCRRSCYSEHTAGTRVLSVSFC
jgi:hypothetical protein